MRVIKNLIFISIVILFYSAVSFGQNYVQARPEQGEGIYSLLRRYELPASNQYVQSFRDLNKELLQKQGSIQVGFTYKLPILRFRYNGKTIRSTLGISDFALAKEIEQYNLTVARAGLKADSYKIDKDLWVPFHLDKKNSGSNYQVTTGQTNSFSIFGSKYNNVEKIDDQLAGRVYYLVSGHGGPDPGAIGIYGKNRLHEDEYAYDITLRFARNLLQHGATVYIIVQDPNDGIRDVEILRGDKDEYYYGGHRISSKAKTRLKDRATIINSLYEKHRQTAKSQDVIVLHVDSRSNKKRIDIFYYYQNSKQRSKNLAFKLYRTIRDKYNQVQPGRGYRGTVENRNLYMINNCKPSTVYIELGNIRNPLDQQRFMLENNRQAVANWLTQGILNFE